MSLHSVALYAGLLLGGLLTIIGWNGKPSSAHPSADRRMVVVTYGIGGLLVTVVADWKRILPMKDSGDVDALNLFANYLGGFVIAMAAVIVCYIVMIAFASYRTPYGPSRAVLDFLFYGYAYFTEKLDQSVSEARKTQQKDRTFSEATGKAAQYFAGIVL